MSEREREHKNKEEPDHICTQVEGERGRERREGGRKAKMGEINQI